MKRCLIIVNFLLLSAVAAGETNYAFRARMAELHPRRLIENAKPPAADEMSVDKTWSIVVEDADENGVMNHAADDLRDYFHKSMNVRLGKGTRNSIVLAVDSALEPLQSKVSAAERDGAKTIRITGVDAREVYQGCCRLEDLMNRRGMPAVKKGEKTFTRMFSPRMTHSGWEIEKYPDEYMDQIVHAGMDSIIVYIEKSPDITRNGRADIPELVERAKKRGLDVYAYANFPVEAAKFHPLDAGAPVFLQRAVFGQAAEAERVDLFFLRACFRDFDQFQFTFIFGGIKLRFGGQKYRFQVSSLFQILFIEQGNDVLRALDAELASEADHPFFLSVA